MPSVTAIILSRHPLSNKAKALKVPDGIKVLNFVSEFKSFRSYQRSWFMAVAQVLTEWFFFLDDDDGLPPGFLGLLDRILGQVGTAALAYTNELVINDAGIAVESRKTSYSQDEHVRNAMLCHHLVLGRTEVAKRAMEVCPRGDFTPEPLVYFQMAKEGAIWVDEIGYHWHRSAGGVNRWVSALAAQSAARRWCAENRELPSPAEASPKLVKLEASPPPPMDPGLVPHRPVKKTAPSRTNRRVKG
jgi:hypothetical protein